MKRFAAIMMAAMFACTSMGNTKITGDNRENILEPDENGALPSKIVNANGNPLGVDTATRALIGITYAHHEIHSGSHFFTGNFTTLANAAVYDILFVTADTNKYAHMIFEIGTQGESMFSYYEGVTASTNGTALVTYDRNRTTDNAANTLFFHTPTVTDLGVVIGAGIFGSGNKAGGSTRDSSEFVLKPNTKYLMRVTNNTAQDNWYDWFFDWYEHTDKTD
jgi:hypothetical protein